jgi:stage II sporulation protein P
MSKISNQKNISNSEFVRLLLAEGNPNFTVQKKEKKNFLDSFLSLFHIDLVNPFQMIKSNYSYQDYADNSSDEEEQPTGSEYVEDPYPEKEVTEPIVYLYNTHQLEEYKQENQESYNVTPNVMMLSYIVREKLNDKGIPTIVEENDVSAFLQANNWSYASSYKVTKLLMEDAKTKNPTLKYFIDLHRDSVSKSISTATINGKNYAKILFIIGLENPNYQENLTVTTTINNMLEEKYPGITRGIYKKEGKGVNGVYNQDFDKNTILFEVGGPENTIEEVLNTADAISTVLAEYIKGDI